MYYSLISYSDVWGNKSSGYEINNQCVEFDDWFIADDCTDKEIVDYLFKCGYINTNDIRKVRIETDGENMEVYAVKNHFPLYGIYANFN